MNYSTKETAFVIEFWRDIPDNFTGVINFWNNNYYWFVNGRKHREDGPAVIYSDGHKFWYLNDYSYSQEQWFEQLTPEQQISFLWNL